MKISIVTPSFNQAPYLERTLRSIHGQAGDFELEHMVMDGGSTDGSVDILDRWIDRLEYTSGTDGGQSECHREGFARASGEVMGWLNSDDLYLPGALESVRNFFTLHPEARWAVVSAG